MTRLALTSLLKRTFEDWNEDNAPRLGAALAFYTILSISPLVVLVLSIVSLFTSQENARAHLLSEVQSLIGMDGRHAIEVILESGKKASSGIFATCLGLATLLFGASGVFGELRAVLNTIWRAQPKPESSIRHYVRERVFSFGLVISVGFILLVSLVMSAALDVITKYFGHLLPVPAFLLLLLNFMISFLGIAALFAMIFKYVPETQIEWRDVRVGAIATALLFTIGKNLLALYLGRMSPGSSYGAAGSLVVMVIWVYYSAQIFFFGAEFTHVYASSRGTTS